MFYFIDQRFTPSFPIGFVKSESDFIIRPAETDLGRWSLVVVVISAVAYPFWLSQTWPVTLRLQEQLFYGWTVLPDIKETKLGSSNQETFPLPSKNAKVVLVPFRTWKRIPTAISGGVDITEVPECHFIFNSMK